MLSMSTFSCDSHNQGLRLNYRDIYSGPHPNLFNLNQEFCASDHQLDLEI